jgi:hypothetical protein
MCDFESGELTWVEGPLVGVRLRDLAGSSSLCATGTYRVDAMVRVTAASCTNGARCTLVDQQVSRSMMADGRDLARFASVTVSGITPMYDAIEIVSLRVLDPSGAAIAASGLTEVRSLEKPRISLGNDRIRIQATFPIPVGATALDPVRGDGLTVTLTDRDGPVFDVTIPPERWHVQRPAGHRWDYRNADGMLSGVRTARLKRVLKARRVIGYALDLEAKGVDLSAADFPGITLTLTLPGLPTGVFSAQQHRTCRATASTLDCR